MSLIWLGTDLQNRRTQPPEARTPGCKPAGLRLDQACARGGRSKRSLGNDSRRPHIRRRLHRPGKRLRLASGRRTHLAAPVRHGRRAAQRTPSKSSSSSSPSSQVYQWGRASHETHEGSTRCWVGTCSRRHRPDTTIGIIEAADLAHLSAAAVRPHAACTRAPTRPPRPRHVRARRAPSCTRVRTSYGRRPSAARSPPRWSR